MNFYVILRGFYDASRCIMCTSTVRACVPWLGQKTRITTKKTVWPCDAPGRSYSSETRLYFDSSYLVLLDQVYISIDSYIIFYTMENTCKSRTCTGHEQLRWFICHCVCVTEYHVNVRKYKCIYYDFENVL